VTITDSRESLSINHDQEGIKNKRTFLEHFPFLLLSNNAQ
jgi:hypothetical protein